MTVQSVADVLEEAKRLIEEKGWIQRAGRSLDGACCAGVALDEAMYATGEYSRVIAAREYFYRAIGRASIPALIDWNDAEGRTKEEVLAAFDRAIAQARGDAARQERT